MVRTTTYNYEQSSEAGRERHLDVPYARLEDATPTKGDPAAVLSAVAGNQITGTIVHVDATDSIAILNVADGAVYLHNVRNVRTYADGSEATWGAINIGDPVWYDGSATMPANTYLSTSPLDSTGTANPLFGHIVMLQDESSSDFPKGSESAGSTQECAVQQV